VFDVLIVGARPRHLLAATNKNFGKRSAKAWVPSEFGAFLRRLSRPINMAASLSAKELKLIPRASLSERGPKTLSRDSDRADLGRRLLLLPPLLDRI